NSISDPMLNSNNQVAFSSTLSGGPTTSNFGIWSGAPGSVALVVRKGDTAPGLGGATFSSISTPFDYNNANQVAFGTGLQGPGIVSGTGGNNFALWLNSGGSNQLIARKNDPAPGGASNFNSLGTPRLGGSGQVAFFSSLMSGGAGIWAGGSEATLQLVA